MLFANRLHSSAYLLNFSTSSRPKRDVPLPHRTVMDVTGGTTSAVKRWPLVAPQYVDSLGPYSMNSLERCRRDAAACLKLARSATNNGDKALLIQMAETWRRLAERAEAQVATRDDEKS
jgi:hypothetical protein